METFSKRFSGISLLLGAAMSVLTMVLHPLGGDMEYIVKIKSVLVFSHGMAIACAPFIGFGLWGLSKALRDNHSVSVLALFIALWGLGAATLAGTINGFVLPQFASAYVGSDVDTATLRSMLDYGYYFNKSLAYIFMTAIIVAILLWSLLMTYQKDGFRWLGYYGLLVFALGAAALFFNANMVSVSLFGTFIFGMASWLIAAAVLLIKQKLVKSL